MYNSGSIVRGFPLFRQLKLLFQLPRLRRTICEELRDFRSAILITNSLRATVLSALLFLPREIKVVGMLHDGLRSSLLPKPMQLIAQLAYSSTDFVVSNSRWSLKQVFFKRDSATIGSFCDQAFFDVPLTPPPSAEGRGPLRLLLLSRISYWKGQHVVLEAIASSPLLQNVHLTIAGKPWFGEDEYLGALRKIADSSSNVTFVGHVDDVVSLIDQHDIVIHSSVSPEPYGQVIVQGMARARVVVATAEGGPLELVEHGTTGMLVPAGVADEMAQVLESLVVDGDLRGKLATKGRASSAHWHPSRMAAELTRSLERFQ